MLALIILWALQHLEKRIAQKFKQNTLSIEIDKDAGVKDILNKIEETENINFTDFSINKKDTGLFIQLKFENINAQKSIGLLNNLQGDSGINKIY